MKIITLLLLCTSVSIVQAKVYKCPGKVQGQFVYQQQACKGAKPEEHTVTIIPFDQQKIEAAQKTLADDMAARKEKETKATAPATEATQNNTAKSTVTNTTTAPAPMTPPPAPVVAPVESAQPPAN